MSPNSVKVRFGHDPVRPGGTLLREDIAGLLANAPWQPARR